jgi:hypothetical protein
MSGGKEYLSYNRNLSWNGLLLFVAIPIPILLPIGHNETTLVFERDKFVEVNSDYINDTMNCCLLNLIGQTELFACESISRANGL